MAFGCGILLGAAGLRCVAGSRCGRPAGSARAAAARPARRAEGQVRAADASCPIPPAIRRPPPRSRWASACSRTPSCPSTGTIACTSCHDPKLSFTDGESTGKGVTGKPLVRHTPTLWNVAWSPLLFWDGRAVEPGGPGPLSRRAPRRDGLHPRERRGAPLAPRQLRAAPSPKPSRRTRRSRPATSPRRSPPTSARWSRRRRASTNGSPAMRRRSTPSEVNGFAIFTGKGRCINCHTGFAFTDHGFYDIGLPSEDTGRGADRRPARRRPRLQGADPARARLDRALHARRLARHPRRRGAHLRDGRRRPPDAQPRTCRDIISLTDQERADLVAFLESLSSETPPQPSTEAWVNAAPPARAAAARATPRSSARPTSCSRRSTSASRPGSTLTVLNDDTRTHNVRIFDPALRFQLRRPGAARERDHPLSRPRHLRGLLRHPPLDAADGGGGVARPAGRAE